MAATETTVCNQALSKLGARRIIGLDEESPEARACQLSYAETRDEVLRHHRWNFSIRRAELTPLAEAPLYGWEFQYTLPVDCLRLLDVNGWEVGSRPDAWEVEGRKLLTNESPTKIRYIAQITDCNLFDAIFVEALALKLAAKIALPINGSGEMAEQLLMEYEKVVGSRARRTDAFEGRPSRRPAWMQSDLVTSRFGVR
jgi:hypothetical protein